MYVVEGTSDRCFVFFYTNSDALSLRSTRQIATRLVSASHKANHHAPCHRAASGIKQRVLSSAQGNTRLVIGTRQTATRLVIGTRQYASRIVIETRRPATRIVITKQKANSNACFHRTAHSKLFIAHHKGNCHACCRRTPQSKLPRALSSHSTRQSATRVVLTKREANSNVPCNREAQGV